jgi:hypothetical protein
MATTREIEAFNKDNYMVMCSFKDVYDNDTLYQQFMNLERKHHRTESPKRQSFFVVMPVGEFPGELLVREKYGFYSPNRDGKSYLKEGMRAPVILDVVTGMGNFLVFVAVGENAPTAPLLLIEYMILDDIRAVGIAHFAELRATIKEAFEIARNTHVPPTPSHDMQADMQARGQLSHTTNIEEEVLRILENCPWGPEGYAAHIARHPSLPGTPKHHEQPVRRVDPHPEAPYAHRRPSLNDPTDDYDLGPNVHYNNGWRVVIAP